MKKICFNAFVLLVAFTLFQGCSKDKEQSEQVKLSDTKLTVKVFSATNRDFEQRVVVQGSVEAKDMAEVSSRVSGPLTEVCVDMGDVVEAGKTKLFEVDKTELENKLRVAEEDLNAAKTALVVAEANHKKAKVDFDKAERDAGRYERLFEQKLVTDNEYETVKAHRDASSAQLAIADASILQAKQGISQAEAMYEIAKRNLSDAVIFAPISGTIYSRYHEVGERVEKGTPVVSVYSNQKMKASAFLPSFYYEKIKVGETTFGLEINGNIVGEFKVSAKSPVVDMKLRTFAVRGELAGSDIVVAGAMGNFTFILEKHNGVSVPDFAVLLRKGKEVVFVENGGVVKETVVVTGTRNDGFVEIKEGLNVCDKVVVEGQTQLFDGRSVLVAE